MKLAIMQPYLFPYIGYFQLMKAVDRFVLLDDVSYINRGWINRNQILLAGKPFLFSMPLKQVSQNKNINEIERVIDQRWAKKFMSTVATAYKKAPYYVQASELISTILDYPDTNLSRFIHHSLQCLVSYLQLTTELVPSSTRYGNHLLKGQDRIIDICRHENCREYINAIGGAALYQPDAFAQHGIRLRFLQTDKHLSYPQFGSHFVPNLSIIDALMFNTPDQLHPLLNAYTLLSAENGHQRPR